MYAFSPMLRDAWKTLFSNLHYHLRPAMPEPLKVKFEDTGKLFDDAGFFLGQTCGYPYTTHLQHTHQLVCAPEFDAQGCSGINYSSWLIVHSSDRRTSLEQFKNSIAVVNNFDSNSGMNIFRHAVSQVSESCKFFHRVLTSGSHISSIQLVQERKADIAAIDAVTWKLAKDAGIIKSNQVRILGQCEATPGLPFVTSAGNPLDPKMLCDAMNTCLRTFSSGKSPVLGIRKFTIVHHNQYDRITELEEIATLSGYPELK